MASSSKKSSRQKSPWKSQGTSQDASQDASQGKSKGKSRGKSRSPSKRKTQCGTVSIVGRPNVGKSTLLNKLIGQKLSITAHKPQTTRHSIIGVKTDANLQIIYVDTPGIHVDGKRALNQVLNRTASSSLHDVDAVLMLVHAMVWNDDDQRCFELVCKSGTPFYMVVNKVDTIKKKSDLLPYLTQLPQHESLQDVLLISARSGDGVSQLESAVASQMPEAAFQFGEDDLTDRSSRFLASEAVREQLTRFLSAELPYSLTVEIEQFEESPELLRIGAVIWVEKNSQKGIIIGKGGERLKEVGSRARKSMEVLFGCKVFLQMWVKVKEGWADDERALRSLGYEKTGNDKPGGSSIGARPLLSGEGAYEGNDEYDADSIDGMDLDSLIIDVPGTDAQGSDEHSTDTKSADTKSSDTKSSNKSGSKKT